MVINDYGPAHVLAQADGSLRLVPLSTPARLHRVTAGGLLDLSYGGGTGVVLPPATHAGEQIFAAEAEGSDHIVVQVGPAFPAGPSSLVRIGPDGSTDPAFGTAGRVELAGLGEQSPTSFFVQRDRRIIVEVQQTSTAMALARLTSNGLLDASFNASSSTPGWLLIDPSPDADHNHFIFDLTEVAGGKLLAIGDRPIATEYAVRRCRRDLSLRRIRGSAATNRALPDVLAANASDSADRLDQCGRNRNTAGQASSAA